MGGAVASGAGAEGDQRGGAARVGEGGGQQEESGGTAGGGARDAVPISDAVRAVVRAPQGLALCHACLQSAGSSGEHGAEERAERASWF
ncbi:MAG: hypothetical protein MUF54_20370 [Polyangiaceae bacterium]|nr:hypothetical protein [Polyangiaceae bacterium]